MPRSHPALMPIKVSSVTSAQIAFSAPQARNVSAHARKVSIAMSRQFTDRVEAGRALAKRLGPLDPKNTIVFALPRGGLPVAAEIAGPSSVPLDLLLVRKIGAPGHEELAVGAVVDGDQPEFVFNEPVAMHLGLSHEDIRKMGADDLEEIERRRAAYLDGRAPPSVRGKTAIVVDDGIATGASMKAALRALKKRGPDRIIMAVPVAPADTLLELREEADEIICVETPYPFLAVGNHYRNFPQVGDTEVISIMNKSNKSDMTDK